MPEISKPSGKLIPSLAVDGLVHVHSDVLVRQRGDEVLEKWVVDALKGQASVTDAALGLGVIALWIGPGGAGYIDGANEERLL